MSTEMFNKLVRDRIPTIIEADGRKAVTRMLSDDEYGVALRKKLIEETQEFGESGTLEELADILEVVYALAALLGADAKTLEEARASKCRERGGFDEKLFLIEAEVLRSP